MCVWVHVCICTQVLKRSLGMVDEKVKGKYIWMNKRHIPLYMLYLPHWITLRWTKMLPSVYLYTRTVSIVDTKFVDSVLQHSFSKLLFPTASMCNSIVLVCRAIQAAATRLSEVKSDMKAVCSLSLNCLVKISWRRKMAEFERVWNTYFRIQKDITLIKWKDCIITKSWQNQ